MEPVSPVLIETAPGTVCRELVIAKDDPNYTSLPALRSALWDGACVTSRWKLTWRERLYIFWKGNLYIRIMTFGQPLQPFKPSVEEPPWRRCV